MQVFEPTPNQLALWTRPNWLIMLMGGILIVLGVIAAVVPGKATTLTITRTGPSVGGAEIHVTTAFRDYRIVRIPLRMLEGAMVTPQSFNGHDAHFYHLDLDVRDGLGAFYFAWYANHEKVAAEAARINAFLADPKAHELVVVNDKRPFYFPVGGFIAFMGLTLLFWGSLAVRAMFDREHRRVTVHQRGFLGTNVVEVPFTAVQGIHVAGITGDCLLYMELEGGRKVSLSASTDMQSMIGPSRIRAIRLAEAQRIREFCAAEPIC
jgi:hypothetical protein